MPFYNSDAHTADKFIRGYGQTASVVVIGYRQAADLIICMPTPY